VPVNEAEEILALSLIFVVHLAGGLLLVWGMFDADARARWHPRWWRRGDGPDDPPDDPRPAPSSRPVSLPLADAEPSRVRLRDETPLRDAHPRPARRPPRSPRPVRSPQRR
jgi:hypothetical protein